MSTPASVPPTAPRVQRSLHGAAAYNPGLLSRDELVDGFVARMPLLARLIDAIERDSTGPISKHHLLIGHRGMGKTTMLHRIRYEVEQHPKLKDRWIALTFPEEQYNVAQLSEFYLNCVDALCDVLEENGHEADAQRLDSARDSLVDDSPDVHARAALALLLEYAQAHDKRLLLLVDNIDMVLDRLDEPAHWALRDVLSQQDWLLFMGASTAALEARYRYDEPLFEFFQPHELNRLDLEEVKEVLRALASRHNTPHVSKLIAQEPGRIQTLHVLSGGNPRTVVLLYQVMALGPGADVRAHLEQLLDAVTPFYKARIDAWPFQTQKVIDAIAIHWDPVSANELAEATRLPVNTVSSQLARLVREGMVEKLSISADKRLRYQLVERFFNIFYLMRKASRRTRSRLLWLVNFLRMFYGSDELNRRAHHQLRASDSHNSEYRLRNAAMAPAYATSTDDPYLLHAMEPDGLDVQHTTATIVIARGKWQEGLGLLRRNLEAATDAYLERCFDDIVKTLAEAVKQRRAAEAREMLAEAGFGQRWRPVAEALRAIAANDAGLLSELAPEVQVPTRELVARLTGGKGIAKVARPPKKPRRRGRPRS